MIIIKDRKNLIKRLNYVINNFEGKLIKIEKEEKLKEVMKEISQNTLSLFPLRGQQIYKDIYSYNRLAGNSKEISSQLTTKILLRSFKINTNYLLNGIEKESKKICNRLKFING